MLLFLSTIAFADPLDIPEDSDSTEDSTEKTNTEPKQQSDNDNESEQSEKGDTIKDIKIEENIIEDIVIPENFTLPDDFSDEANNSEASEADFDFQWFRGTIDYRLDIRFWNANGIEKTLYSGSFAGSPQYMWAIKDNIGPTLGLRFAFRGNETQQTLVQDVFVGPTVGFQLKKLRLNSSANYMFHQLYYQYNQSKNLETNSVQYDYIELLPITGLYWENTLTYSFKNFGNFVQASFGVPVVANGDREMGVLFQDSWRTGVDFCFSTFLIGYAQNRYPNHTEQVITIGSAFGK